MKESCIIWSPKTFHGELGREMLQSCCSTVLSFQTKWWYCYSYTYIPTHSVAYNLNTVKFSHFLKLVSSPVIHEGDRSGLQKSCTLCHAGKQCQKNAFLICTHCIFLSLEFLKAGLPFLLSICLLYNASVFSHLQRGVAMMVFFQLLLSWRRCSSSSIMSPGRDTQSAKELKVSWMMINWH